MAYLWPMRHKGKSAEVLWEIRFLLINKGGLAELKYALRMSSSVWILCFTLAFFSALLNHVVWGGDA